MGRERGYRSSCCSGGREGREGRERSCSGAVRRDDDVTLCEEQHTPPQQGLQNPFEVSHYNVLEGNLRCYDADALDDCHAIPPHWAVPSPLPPLVDPTLYSTRCRLLATCEAVCGRREGGDICCDCYR